MQWKAVGSSPRCPPPLRPGCCPFLCPLIEPLRRLVAKSARFVRFTLLEMRKASLLALLVAAGCHPDPEGGVPVLSRAVASTPALTTASSSPTPIGRAASPSVSLDGVLHDVPAAVDAAGTRLFAKALRAWVFATPSAAALKLGYLRAGASSPTTGKPAGFDGCPGGWFPVEPEGFVCAGPTATTDARDAVVVATQGTRPDLSRRLPYIYGTVRKPGPIYGRVPSAAELAQAEPDLAERMSTWLAADGEVGARYAPQVWLAGAAPGLSAAQAWASKARNPCPNIWRLPGETRLKRRSSSA